MQEFAAEKAKTLASENKLKEQLLTHQQEMAAIQARMQASYQDHVTEIQQLQGKVEKNGLHYFKLIKWSTTWFDSWLCQILGLEGRKESKEACSAKNHLLWQTMEGHIKIDNAGHFKRLKAQSISRSDSA